MDGNAGKHGTMLITANRLTLLRIVLLPLPYFLLYGGTWARVTALAAFALLGLTDYLDGLLARRQGVTELGKLLDPIADKIFLAACLIPLVDLGILPLWLVWIIFLREYLVTEIRTFLTGLGMNLPVSELAKIKTTLQMTGAGLILLCDTFPDKTVTAAFLAGALLATVFLAVGLYWRDGGLSQRIRMALFLLALGLFLLLALDTRGVIMAYGLVMLLVTMISGGGYLLKGIPVCMGQGAAKMLGLLSSISVPLVALAFSGRAEGLNWLIILIMAAEFSSQGIDMWAARTGGRDISTWKKYLAAPAVLAAFAFLPPFMGEGRGVSISLVMAAVLAFFYTSANIWTHYSVFGDLLSGNSNADHPRRD